MYMFGYSRGAYNVHSLAGMIQSCGLVRRDQLQFVKEAYDLYRNEMNDASPKNAEFLNKHRGMTPIKLVACFDTVGVLGIPGDSGLAKWTNRS